VSFPLTNLIQMKSPLLCLSLGVALCTWSSHAASLRARNATTANKKLTGLLCRDSGVAGKSDDVDVVLEEGGRRSLVFSRNVADSTGKVMGREVAGVQSTVHCAVEVAHPEDAQCLPADLNKPVPTCSEVGESRRCPCAVVVNEPLKLPYQNMMVSETVKLCEAKAKSKQPFRVLMFGLGGGAIPTYIRQRCDSAYIESVESDSRVALIAQRLFGFKADEKNKVEIADGAEAAVRQAATHPWPAAHYDAVLVDCFGGDNHVAPSCRSERFMHAIRTALGPDGQVLQNVMDTDLRQVMPMYEATFGKAFTSKKNVQNGQFLISARTHSNHPRRDHTVRD